MDLHLKVSTGEARRPGLGGGVDHACPCPGKNCTRTSGSKQPPDDALDLSGDEVWGLQDDSGTQTVPLGRATTRAPCLKSTALQGKHPVVASRAASSAPLDLQGNPHDESSVGATSGTWVWAFISFILALSQSLIMFMMAYTHGLTLLFTFLQLGDWNSIAVSGLGHLGLLPFDHIVNLGQLIFLLTGYTGLLFVLSAFICFFFAGCFKQIKQFENDFNDPKTGRAVRIFAFVILLLLFSYPLRGYYQNWFYWLTTIFGVSAHKVSWLVPYLGTSQPPIFGLILLTLSLLSLFVFALSKAVTIYKKRDELCKNFKKEGGYLALSAFFIGSLLGALGCFGAAYVTGFIIAICCFGGGLFVIPWMFNIKVGDSSGLILRRFTMARLSIFVLFIHVIAEGLGASNGLSGCVAVISFIVVLLFELVADHETVNPEALNNPDTTSELKNTSDARSALLRLLVLGVSIALIATVEVARSPFALALPGIPAALLMGIFALSESLAEPYVWMQDMKINYFKVVPCICLLFTALLTLAIAVNYTAFIAWIPTLLTLIPTPQSSPIALSNLLGPIACLLFVLCCILTTAYHGKRYTLTESLVELQGSSCASGCSHDHELDTGHNHSLAGLIPMLRTAFDCKPIMSTREESPSMCCC